MPKLIVPKNLYYIDGYNLRATSDLDTNNKILQNPNAQYELNIKNNRKYLNIKTDFFEKFKVSNELELNCENTGSLYIKLFDYFLYPKQRATFADVPNLTIKANKNISIQSSHMSKQASLANDSCLENLTLGGSNFYTKINSFHKLKKFKTLKSIATPNDYSANQFKFVNCGALKEIDISSVEDFGNYCQIFLSKIPDDCQIKFSKALWTSTKNIIIDKNKKDTIDFWLFNEKQNYYFYNRSKSATVNLEDYVKADNDPVVMSYKKLKEIISKISQKLQPKEQEPLMR